LLVSGVASCRLVRSHNVPSFSQVAVRRAIMKDSKMELALRKAKGGERAVEIVLDIS